MNEADDVPERAALRGQPPFAGGAVPEGDAETRALEQPVDGGAGEVSGRTTRRAQRPEKGGVVRICHDALYSSLASKSKPLAPNLMLYNPRNFLGHCT